MDIPVRHLPHNGQECPSYTHPEILQPLEHTTVRVKVELTEPVPDGVVGALHPEGVTKLAGETYGRRFLRGQRPAPNGECQCLVARRRRIRRLPTHWFLLEVQEVVAAPRR